MQKNLTWFLLAAALCLFAGIYLFERTLPSSAQRREPKHLLPVETVDDIDAIQLSIPQQGLIRAEKTGTAWSLIEPAYPAREVALQSFATNLVRLRILDRIPAKEASLEGKKSFGFDPPRAEVEVRADSNVFRFEIGKIAPLTSNLYVRLPDSGDIILTDAALLSTLPKGTNDWRTPALLQLSGLDFDHIQVRGGPRSFELGRSPTNNLWQISKPVPARADQDRVLELLHILRSSEASDFVTDTPGTDLERFGLQSPEVEVSFLAGTNRVYSIQFGNSPTNQTNLVYAELIGRTNVVLAPKALVDFLKQPYKAFHDPRLVAIKPLALDRVIIHAKETFTLQRQPTGSWNIDDPHKTPVDRELLNRFVNAVSGLQILDIVKEVPADTELRSFGFLPATASYAFFQKLTNSSGITTNILFTDISFGSAQADKVYARRSDENPVYLTQLAPVLELPKRPFELRDRQIWRFSTNDLVGISIWNDRVTNHLARSGVAWSSDPIANASIEEIVFRLANLNAQDWVEKGTNRLTTFGIGPNSPTIELDLRTGGSKAQSHRLQFGRQTLRRDAYAAIDFPGETEPTIFEFPGDLYQMMLETLPMPK